MESCTCMEFIAGDPIYAETAMKVISEVPERRYKEVVFWMDVMKKQVADHLAGDLDDNGLDCYTWEAWKHGMTALLAMNEMAGRPAQKWDGKTFLADWLEETLKP